MADSTVWYVVKTPAGQCEIVSEPELNSATPRDLEDQWGPFESQGEAIARRVGLIRSGKCKPI